METAEVRLGDAVKNNDLDAARQILPFVTDINHRYPYGKDQFFRLHNFIKSREMLDLLVDHGYDVTLLDSWGQTGLHMAVESGRIDVISQLLYLGLDINVPCGKPRTTPLHWSVTFNRPEVATFLLDRQADPNARDATGKTPLHTACDMRLPAMVTLLTRNGADVSATDDHGSGAREHAIQRKSFSCLLALRRAGCEVGPKDWIKLILNFMD